MAKVYKVWCESRTEKDKDGNPKVTTMEITADSVERGDAPDCLVVDGKIEYHSNKRFTEIIHIRNKYE